MCSGGCGGGVAGWTTESANYPAVQNQKWAWEVHIPGMSEPIVYDTDTEAYAAVSRSGGGVRRIPAPAPAG